MSKGNNRLVFNIWRDFYQLGMGRMLMSIVSALPALSSQGLQQVTNIIINIEPKTQAGRPSRTLFIRSIDPHWPRKTVLTFIVRGQE